MMDVMRQQPEPKKTRQPTSTPKDSNKGEKEGGASNFAQTDKEKTKWACFCCGDEKCRLSTCTKKGTLPKEKSYKPEYYDTWHAQSNAQTTETESCTNQCRNFRTSAVAFSGAQSIVEEENEKK